MTDRDKSEHDRIAAEIDAIFGPATKPSRKRQQPDLYEEAARLDARLAMIEDWLGSQAWRCEALVYVQDSQLAYRRGKKDWSLFWDDIEVQGFQDDCGEYVESIRVLNSRLLRDCSVEIKHAAIGKLKELVASMRSEHDTRAKLLSESHGMLDEFESELMGGA